MREAARDPERIAPIRDDPYFDTEIPFIIHWDLLGALREYLGPLDRYWMVFCPYHRDEAMGGMLADDLADVYGDIKEALLVYRKGTRAARQHAIWMWRFHYHGHWAHHAAMAMNPLTWLVSDAFHEARDP